MGWTVLAPAWWWTLATLGVLLVPPLIASLVDVLHKPDEVPLGQHLAFTSRNAARHGLQVLLSIAWLPHEAFYSAGAILRTHWRMLVTRRRLLEWTPSSEHNRGDPDTLAASFRSMWAAPAIAVAAAALPAIGASCSRSSVAAPILLLWLVSPALAWWLSRPLRAARVQARRPSRRSSCASWRGEPGLTSSASSGPRITGCHPTTSRRSPAAWSRIARRRPTSASRCSPISPPTTSAICRPGRLIERIGKSLQTMESLERHEGHFYNWYDTQSLQPLAPRYVSTVDSGNLAGHLLTLRAGFMGLPDDRIVDLRLFAGMIDTARLLIDSLAPHVPPAVAELRRHLDSAYDARPVSAAAARRWLERLAASIAAAAIDDRAPLRCHRCRASSSTRRAMWIEALDVQCQAALDELILFAPWLQLPDLEEALAELPLLSPIPTLRGPREPDAEARDRTSSACGHRPRRRRSASSSTN